jgi:small GTP-binding protein
MTDDLKIIKQLEKQTGRELWKRRFEDIMNLKRIGFSINEKGQVTGLNLCEIKLSSASLETLSTFQHLKILDLHSTGITDISSLQGLSNLIYLDLRNDQITDISFLQRLGNLTYLNLRNNQITDISSLQGLGNLAYLDLSYNKIKQLAETILELGLEIDVDSDPFNPFSDKTTAIFLKGNPLEKPPIEIIEKGKEAIRTYFKSLEGKKQNLNEVKILLVGDGGAGKTSLVKRLLNQGFDKNEDQTHGINIRHCKVKSGNLNIIVHIWDFGGQEIMHATHQFFLSKRSLYILVLDGRKDEKTEYWLKLIQSFGGMSPVLVVLNKMDQNPAFDVNRLFLQEKYKNIKGFYRVSCADERGLKEFFTAFNRELANVEMIRTTWAVSWFNVKKQLEDNPQPYISYDHYRQLCSKEEIPEPTSQETLLDFLNDLGVVLHFKDFELQDTHVLDPRWVTEAVYKIINSEKLAESHGVLNLEQLDNILKKKQEEDYHYPRDKYRFIVRLMQKFELCYRIDDRRFLTPDLLAVQEPVIDFDYQAALKFIIQYDFLPRSIMPRFIVNMHKDIKKKLQWRTGVVLEDKDFLSTAVVKADHEAKRIYIYVNGEQKRDYFAVLLAVLRRIHRSFEKLKTKELIPMPDEPDITADYKQLVRFEKQGIDVYLPGETEKEYKVSELLGTITTGKITEEEILGLLKKMKEILLALESERNPKETMLKTANEILDLKLKTPIGDINLGKLVEKVLHKKKKNNPAITKRNNL